METPSAVSALRLASALISAQLSERLLRGAEARLVVSLVVSESSREKTWTHAKLTDTQGCSGG